MKQKYNQHASFNFLVIDKHSDVGVSKLSKSNGMDEVINKGIRLHGPIAGSSITSRHFNSNDRDNS